MKIPVADIRRLTLHDGPGTRTTVFVKGCPLRCLWCHNPESLSAEPRLLFHDTLCIGCGRCAAVCPAGVHAFDGGAHRLDRSRCRARSFRSVRGSLCLGGLSDRRHAARQDVGHSRFPVPLGEVGGRLTPLRCCAANDERLLRNDKAAGAAMTK